MYLYRDFVRHCNQLYLDLFNDLTFLPKKIRRSQYVCTIFFFFIDSVSNICSTVADFPAKRLRKKYGAQKYACADFFFLKCYVHRVYFYFYHILTNKSIKISIFVLSFLIYTQYTKHVSFNRSICLFSIAS